MDSKINIRTHSEICRELSNMYSKKNQDYGDSFHKSFEEWGMMMACIRLGDKYNRICSLSKQDAKVEDESLRDTLLDMANYAIMTVMELDSKYSEGDEEV